MAVYNMLLEGWTDKVLVPEIVRLYQVKARQARNYIKRARVRMQGVRERAEDNALAYHVAARRRLLRDAKGIDLKLKVLKDEAQLLGLYDRSATGKKDDPIYEVHDVRGLSDDELRRMAERGK